MVINLHIVHSILFNISKPETPPITLCLSKYLTCQEHINITPDLTWPLICPGSFWSLLIPLECSWPTVGPTWPQLTRPTPAYPNWPQLTPTDPNWPKQTSPNCSLTLNNPSWRSLDLPNQLVEKALRTQARPDTQTKPHLELFVAAINMIVSLFKTN